TDPNFGDQHTWHLVYKGQTEDVFKDSRYKAGQTTLVGTTPLWVQINPLSGALSGTPAQADAPHSVNDPDCGVPDTVLVVVEDQCGLTDWKWIQLNTDSTNHLPHFLRGPKTICITNKTQFCDSIPVVDKDLTRLMCADSLSFTMVKPYTAAGDTVNFTGSITPVFVKGKTHDDNSSVLTNDTAYLRFCGTFNVDNNYFANPQPVIFKFAVSDNSWGINNTDSTGHVDTLVYKVYIGDVPTFECAVYVSNKFDNIVHPNVDIQRLCFGAGPAGFDSLDIRYCEFEIPPAPFASTFDARWELPVGGSLKGTLIDIRRDTAQSTLVTWQIRFNAGSDNGAFLFPVRICWRPSCLDSTGSFLGNFYLVHGSNPKEFDINMKTGLGDLNPASYVLDRIGSDSLCLEIRDINQKDARIIFIPPHSDAPITSVPKFSLEQNYPNPFASSTRITFNVAERSNVLIAIYDLKGSLVRTLVSNETLEAGEGYPVIWDGTDNNGTVMASGTYICKMVAGDFNQAIKMTLNK
ncbi:MAG: FlgD immunoglobulin-like domain containing protein, partial [Ignavibacteriota bacterium]